MMLTLKVNKIARFFRYTASMAKKNDLAVHIDVNHVLKEVQKEKEKEGRECRSTQTPRKEAINYDILKVVDKVSDTNPTLINWLYDKASDDPFSNSPDMLLRKNWVPRSRKSFFVTMTQSIIRTVPRHE